MFEEFINYLKYIGFISDETFPILSSKFNSIPEENSNNNPRLKIIVSMSNYIKSLSEDQSLNIMAGIYERYLENKIKISSEKLLNLFRIYQNKDLKFYLIYWNKLSQYLMHKEIQKYQQYQTNYNNKSNDEFFKKKNINNNFNNIQNNVKKNLFNNNISSIKLKNNQINIISGNNKSNNAQHLKSKSSSKEFFERQKKFIQMKQKKLMKNIDSNEEEFQLLYPFKPNLEIAKIPFNGNNKDRNENLYSNKLHEMRIKNLREVIDNERGYTFKPRITPYKAPKKNS